MPQPIAPTHENRSSPMNLQQTLQQPYFANLTREHWNRFADEAARQRRDELKSRMKEIDEKYSKVQITHSTKTKEE